MAVYSLTDHEYRRALSLDDNVTPWITCNLTNSRIEVDGTYTIIDIPDEDIPTGLFQVRVKAIGSRHASAILSNDVPFTGGVFNFNNSVYPDGVNDYLKIETIAELPIAFSIGYWCKNTSSPYIRNNGVFGIQSTTDFLKFNVNENGAFLQITGSEGYLNGFAYALGINYVVLNFTSKTNCNLYVNGVLSKTRVFPNNILTNITNFYLLRTVTGEYTNLPTDEFTMYNRALTLAEIQSNYNSGLGSNPISPEDLLFRLKFEEFETFTFPSGSGLGIKDFSGNNNHAKQFNMDTNPSSPNYVLKPFI